MLDGDRRLAGVLTRRDLLRPDAPEETPLGGLVHEPPRFVHDDARLREAADLMVAHDIGRLPVVERAARAVVGMVTRSDLLAARRRRLAEAPRAERSIRILRRAS